MCPRKAKPTVPTYLPGFNPDFDQIRDRVPSARVLASTAESVFLSVATTREGTFRLFWGSRNSGFCEVHSGKTMFEPSSFFAVLPEQRRAGGLTDYVAKVEALRKRLHVPIQSERRTYMVGNRGLTRANQPVEILDVLDRIEGGGKVMAPTDWGFALLGGGSGRLPPHLGYLTPEHRKRNRGVLGYTLSESVGVALDRLHGAVVRMRADFKGTDREGVYTWAGFSSGDSPEEGIQSLHLSPELWIRRRIARRSSVLSLSIFGTHQLKNGKWEVVDLTAPAALLATGTDNAGPAWRRAVYLVNRGDGYEWVLLHPDHDNYPTEASGVPGVEYEGSPARSLVSSLRTLWDDGDKVKIRWILDDKPLQGAGEVR